VVGDRIVEVGSTDTDMVIDMDTIVTAKNVVVKAVMDLNVEAILEVIHMVLEDLLVVLDVMVRLVALQEVVPMELAVPLEVVALMAQLEVVILMVWVMHKASSLYICN